MPATADRQTDRVSSHLTALITDLTAGSKSSTETSQVQPFSSKPSSMLESVAGGGWGKIRKDYVDVLQVFAVVFTNTSFKDEGKAPSS